MHSRNYLLIMSALAACAVLSQGCSQASGQGPERIPVYEVQDLQGNPVSLEDLRGRPALVNVWATWCEPCREEIPYLQSLHEEYSARGLQIVGASVDSAGETGRVASFADSMGVTYAIWRDPAEKATFGFQMLGLPETILLDGDGAVLHQWRGAIEPGRDVEIRIEGALGMEGSGPPEEYGIETVGLGIAFAAGILSFLSPCVLPLIPTYATFIAGTSVKEIAGSAPGRPASRIPVLSRGVLFVIGFSVVFITLGVVVSYLGSVFADVTAWIERIGGAIIILFGLHLLGVLKIRQLNYQRTLDMSNRSATNTGTLLVGMAFGAGWTPCIGPILAGILTIAAASTTVYDGAVLLSVYSAGLAIPFVLSALAINQFLVFFRSIRRWMGWIERVSGALLIGIGILLLTGSLTALSNMFGNTLTLESG